MGSFQPLLSDCEHTTVSKKPFLFSGKILTFEKLETLSTFLYLYLWSYVSALMPLRNLLVQMAKVLLVQASPLWVEHLHSLPVSWDTILYFTTCVKSHFHLVYPWAILPGSSGDPVKLEWERAMILFEESRF